jgi:DHA1 family bicyclomycin/chloramphenicol resistance-like MFS transporter
VSTPATHGAHRGARAKRWAFAAQLAALTMIGPFSVDMYLPAFRAIEQDFGVANLAVQQTLSVYLFSYAFMMLWHGALSDALGRRPVVLAGLFIYLGASLGCAIAGNVQSLWVFRAFQGISSGAGVVVGRAIIRDRFHGPEAQRLMAQVTLVFGLAPAIGPIVGGVLLEALGWRSIFWSLVAYAAAMIVWAGKKLPETLPVADRQPLKPSVLWRNYRTVALHAEFLLLAAIPMFNFAGFFLYISSAPTFLEGLGVSTRGFAWLFVPMIGGIMLGSTIAGHFAGRVSQQQTIRIGFTIMFAAVVLNLAIAWFVRPGVPWSILHLFVYTLGGGLMMPTFTLMLLDLFPKMRGMTSSLQGFLQFAFGGVVAGSIAPLLSPSPLKLALGAAVFTLAGFALWLAYLHHTRHPRSPG